MHTGLRVAVIGGSVTSALIPVVASFDKMAWQGLSTVVITLAAFILLLVPHMPVILTARYEPVSRGKLIGLLACMLVFGLVPALGLGLFVLAGGDGGFGFALLLFLGGGIMLLIQLLVFAMAARIARGGVPSHTPAFFRWV
jgi:hypothetical protein